MAETKNSFLSLGLRYIKRFLFTFNMLFVLTGLILIIIGSVIKTPYSAYHYILDHGFFTVPVLLIFIGFIIFIVSFFGCWGALKENNCMLRTFAVSLVLIFILEISGGIAGYVLKDKVTEALETDLKDSIKYYNNSTDVKNMWDIAQSNFKCCGATNVTDWNNTLPASCCKDAPCTVEKAFKKSCYEMLENFFVTNAITLGGAGIGIVVVQILGILCSYTLALSIDKQYESLDK